MTQEDKQLLLQDLCARLPYGVKVMVRGWDYDRDCDFTTIETHIGIDDRFIHTIWDKTGDKDEHSIIEPLSILDYKPYLRSMSSMTEEEEKEFVLLTDTMLRYGKNNNLCCLSLDAIQWLLKKHFDFIGLIPKGLAIEVTEENNPYKE